MISNAEKLFWKKEVNKDNKTPAMGYGYLN